MKARKEDGLVQELASRAKLGVDRFRLAAAFHDDRVCVLCLQAGDGDPAGCGRLLSVDAGKLRLRW